MIFYNKYKKFRIENNIDLKDISKRTKIDLKYLQSIERGKFAEIPHVYVKLFFKAYINEIGVDINEALFELESFLNQKPKIGQKNISNDVVFGSIFIGSTVMAIYVGFIRPNGFEATWAFFNLIFLQNLSAFIAGFYSTKINKLGHTDKTSDEAIYAPLFLTILSAILCYGLADKIYI